MVQYRIRSLITASNIEEIVRNGFLIYFSSFGIFLFLSANALLIPPPAMKQPMHNMNMPKPSESVLMDPFFFCILLLGDKSGNVDKILPVRYFSGQEWRQRTMPMPSL